MSIMMCKDCISYLTATNTSLLNVSIRDEPTETGELCFGPNFGKTPGWSAAGAQLIFVARLLLQPGHKTRTSTNLHGYNQHTI